MKKIFICAMVGICFGTVFTGCGRISGSDSETETTEAPVVYEAENALLQGEAEVETTQQGFSGSGYVTGINNEGDSCTFTVNIEETGFYDLNFKSASQGGYKENFVVVDGESMGVVSVEDKNFTDSILKRVYMEAGEHTVAMEKSWGWINLDNLSVSKSTGLDQDIYQVSAKLVNENANDDAKRLMSYMCDIYGTKFLSGQYSEGGAYSHDMACVWKENGGKYPAVLGLDMIDYTPSRVANGTKGTSTENAIEYWKKGGIVTFCWHWNAPEKYLTGQWYSGFYTQYTDINLEKIMNGEDTEGYDLLMKDIDAIAQQLLILQDAGVPVLWRPLHEASGGWFWWGASGPEAYKKLYVLLYDKLTNEYGLNNLIWIWNGQDSDWYPGDEYVDIIGEDIYPGEQVYTSQIGKYLAALDYTNVKKMIVLSENGCLFDPDLAIRDGAMWGFFSTWGGEFVSKSGGLNIYSEQYTDKEMLKKVYASESVITLDELPDLTTYKIRDDAN